MSGNSEQEDSSTVYEDRRRGVGSGMERHIQTIVGAVILMLLVWQIQTVNANERNLAVMAEQLKGIHARFDDLKDRIEDKMKGRFTAQQAEVLKQQINQLRQRMNRVESQRASMASSPTRN